MIERYYLPLRRFAVSLSRCGVRAEDLAHQTILIYAQRGHQIRDRAKVRQWLFTTLWREHLREVRRGARAVSYFDMDTLASDRSSPADVSICDRQGLRAALARLPAFAREILRLRYFDNLSYREVATILGVPIGTVMSRLCRARRALRAALEIREHRRGRSTHQRAGGRP